MNLWLDIDLTGGYETSERMLRDARNLHLMAHVERLVHLGCIEKNSESAGEVDYLLLADLVNSVVLRLYRHDKGVRIDHASHLCAGIRHSVYVLIEHLWQNLVQSCILPTRQSHALGERRWRTGVDPFLLRCEMQIEYCIASVGELCAIDVVHD